ncbi:MAG: hypothetical protein KDD34_01450, partial [Bdellovibrionales bacterium]|nr:hypothetical protein [Bdellovibrionales bacterium]
MRLVSELDPQFVEFIKYPLLGAFRCGRLMIPKDGLMWIKDNVKKFNILLENNTSRNIGILSEKQIRETLIKRYKNKNSTPYDLENQVNSLYNEQFRQIEDFPKISASNGITLLFEPLGISTSDWSMDFQTNGKFAFSERFGTPSFPFKTLEYAFLQTFDVEDLTCAEIGLKSEKIMSDFFQSELFKKMISKREQTFASRNQPIIQQCMKCHSSGDYLIPQIPFDNPSQLKSALYQKAQTSDLPLIDEIKYRTGPFAPSPDRMPLGLIPSPQQIDELIQYLEAL